MNDTAITEGVISSDPKPVSIDGSLPVIRVRPSQFNARAVAKDGTFLLYNSYSGAFSGLPPQARTKAEALLHREGCSIQQTGLAKYMLDRGFLVPDSTNELNKMRFMHGFQHYRADRMELILLASEECNFRCVYCPEAFSRGTMEPWVRQAVVSMIQRQISRLRSLHVSWFGGEPLLGLEAIRDIAPRMQALARDNGVKFETGDMSTNGFLLTPEVLAELLDYDIRTFQITLDGRPTDHNRTRPLKEGGPSFQTIYNNLKAARDISDQFTIVVRVNFDNDNLPGVRDLLDLLTEDFAGDSRFVLRFYDVRIWDNSKDKGHNLCGKDAFMNKIALAKTAAEKGLNPESCLPDMRGLTGRGVCYAAHAHNLVIGADGKIMKCTVALDQQDRNVVGLLTPDGVTDIKADKFPLWVSSTFENDDTCKRCFYLPVCQGCSCPNIRLQSGKRPCPPEKDHIVTTLNLLWELRHSATNQYHVGEVGTEGAGSFSN